MLCCGWMRSRAIAAAHTSGSTTPRAATSRLISRTKTQSAVSSRAADCQLQLCNLGINVSSPTPARAYDHPASRRPALLLAVAAGLCWACALATLISAGLSPDLPLLAPIRVIYYALTLLAGLLTF